MEGIPDAPSRTPRRPVGPPPEVLPAETQAPKGQGGLSPAMSFMSSLKRNVARRKSERVGGGGVPTSESSVVQNEPSVALGALAEEDEEQEEEEYTPYSKERMRKLMRRSLALSEVKRKGLIEDREQHLDYLEEHVKDHEIKHAMDQKERMLREKEEEVEAMKQENLRIHEEKKLLKSKADAHALEMAQNDEAMRQAQAIEALHSKRHVKAVATPKRMNSPSMVSKKRRETLFREASELYRGEAGAVSSGENASMPGEGHLEEKENESDGSARAISMPDLPPPPAPDEGGDQEQASTPMSPAATGALAFAEQLPEDDDEDMELFYENALSFYTQKLNRYLEQQGKSPVQMTSEGTPAAGTPLGQGSWPFPSSAGGCQPATQRDR